MTTTEFAIVDDRGVQFGLPAKSFDSLEAAKATFDFLTARRGEMKRAAYDATMKLQMANVDQPMSREHVELLDTVRLWDNEKDRRYQIVKREVGEWEKA